MGEFRSLLGDLPEADAGPQLGQTTAWALGDDVASVRGLVRGLRGLSVLRLTFAYVEIDVELE